MDTFYNALNPADQDSLNAIVGGNLLERRAQDVLMIIENKSKVCNSRNKSVVSQVQSCDANSNSEIAKLTHAVNQQTSAVTTSMTAILKQFQATPPPASVKAVDEICITCGGAHPYYQCLAAGGNTFPERRDNIQGYVSAAVVNYNQGNSVYRPPGMANQIRPPGFAQPNVQNNQNRFGQPQGFNRGNNFNPEQSYQAPTQLNQIIPLNELEKVKRMNEANMKAMQTQINMVKNKSGSLPSNTVAKPKGELKAIATRSGLVLDGPTVPTLPPFINPKEDERVEETLTDLNLSEYTIKVPPPHRRNCRLSKQPFILEESLVDTMADQRTMAELLRAPTEGYAEAIAVAPILAEHFELKHSLINMMTSEQFFGLEKDKPHDHIPGVNLLERRTQDVLTIIENKSNVCNFRNKPIVSQVKSSDANSSSSFEMAKLTHAVNQQTSTVTTAMTAILKQFQATSPLASVKAIVEICVTCGYAHPYYHNTIANPKGELKAITTRSGIVLDGHSVPMPSPFINLEEDERVEETLTDLELGEFTIKVPPPLVQKPKPPSQRDYMIPLILGRTFLRTARALIDVHGEEMILRDGLPKLSTRMTLKLANRAICTPARIARDVFVPVGKFTFPADFVIVDYESDPRFPFILGRPFLRTARALIDVHGEEMILRDAISHASLILEDFDPPLYELPFHKEVPRSSDFLPSPEYDSFLFEDFSEVDALPLTNNEDKVFNPGILIQEDLCEVTVQVIPDKNVKKIAISHASLILEDFDPPLYELPFHKEVPSTNEAVNTTHDVSAASLQGHTFASTYADDVMFSFFANPSNSPLLDDEDLEQIDTDDLEEMDLKWQVAMLTMRVKRFIKKIGRNLNFNGKETVGFDKKKLIVTTDT
nr:reverse transcriptase domain-containing protein [Tanacetum cinerariifolium]